MTIPLVLIPGIGSDCSMFDPVVAALDVDVSRIDVELPGYAGTRSIDDYGFSDLAGLIKSALDNQGLERACVLGHSIGGMAALEFAITHRQMCAGLMLSGTTPAFGGRDDSFKDAFLKARLKPLDDGASMADLARQSMPSLMVREIGEALMCEAIDGMARIPESAYRAALRCLVTFNRRNDLDRVACPALLLAGDKDMNAPLKTMQKMAGGIAGAQITIFENTGHMAPLECPAEFAAAVSGFIRSCLP